MYYCKCPGFERSLSGNMKKKLRSSESLLAVRQPGPTSFSQK